jgi:hypothetical protein
MESCASVGEIASPPSVKTKDFHEQIRDELFGPCIEACGKLHAAIVARLSEPELEKQGIIVSSQTGWHWSFEVRFRGSRADDHFDSVSLSVPPSYPRNKTYGPKKFYEIALMKNGEIVRDDDNGHRAYQLFTDVGDVILELERIARVLNKTASASDLAEYDSGSDHESDLDSDSDYESGCGYDSY